jgi:hypothetical protein
VAALPLAPPWWDDTDTLGDLDLGLSGSVLAAAATVVLLWPNRSAPTMR